MFGPSPWIYNKHIIQAWLVSIFYSSNHRDWFKGGQLIQDSPIRGNPEIFGWINCREVIFFTALLGWPKSED